MARVPVSSSMLRWATRRARMAPEEIARRFPQFPAWELGDRQPTLKQLEKFARATHTPLGYLFLPEPPDEALPIPDFRTLGDEPTRPSPNLLDTIYTMQRRQDWLREERILYRGETLGFVGSARLTDDPSRIGRDMRRVLGLRDGWAAPAATWEQAVGTLRNMIEEAGVMAVINGVVGNNTHRQLDVEEFRGFSLCDEYAPLIFVNGADAKSAQMFTLAHELVHVWLGRTGEGLSGFDGLFPGDSEVEDFCNQAAAEFLVPARELLGQWRTVGKEALPFEALARTFKVSPIVAGRRALDLELVDRETFLAFYDDYVASQRRPRLGGGDFYNNQNTRVGQMFATQVVRAAKEGRLRFKEAYDLTGLHGRTFESYARRLGFTLP